MKNKTIRLIDLHNRVADFYMEGTYGYVSPELKEKGFAMITATSVVEEFEVKDTKVVSEKEAFVIGVDKYGREMELPIQRIIDVKFKDTEEQKVLKSTIQLIDLLEQHGAKDSEHYQQVKKTYDELVAKGVKPYNPVRVNQ